MTSREKITYLTKKERYNFEDLRMIMQVLRSKEGCPWDREQDHHSIRSSLIEETYEVIEAIDTENSVLLQEELGDLLFQIVFHTTLEEEVESFSMDDVIHDISAKMVYRHPHVFSGVKVKDSDEVLSNWEAIKTEEKKRNTLVDRLRAIPPMLPALMRASKVGKKAEMLEQEDTDAVLDALEAQIAALREHPDDMFHQIGDLLMTATHLSRKYGVDAEEALSSATDRIIDGLEQK